MSSVVCSTCDRSTLKVGIGAGLVQISEVKRAIAIHGDRSPDRIHRHREDVRLAAAAERRPMTERIDGRSVSLGLKDDLAVAAVLAECGNGRA